MKTVSIFFFLFFTHQLILAQNCEKVLFSGKITDTIRPQQFYNLMIVNRSTGRGVFGQPDGSFSVYIDNHDSISLSLKGYPIINLKVEANEECRFIKYFNISPKYLELPNVVFKPLKSLQEIKEERQALAMRETKTVTGINILESPITALYETFSKKERMKRFIEAQKYQDNKSKILKELLRNYVAYDIIDLNDDEYSLFIDFLNIDENFLKTATEFELITFIKDKYEHFKYMYGIR